MEAADDPQVREFRALITAADDAILAALNRRIELVAALHALKRERSYPLRDAAREDSMLDEMRSGNDGPLSDEGIRQLLAALLDITRSEVSRITKD
jgi:chorismate mutase